MGRRTLAICVLRWVVAIVCIVGAVQLLRVVASGHGPRLPHVVLQAIAIAEIGAGALFLAPGILGRVGGRVLLAVIAVAIAVHLLHGDYAIANLLVYAAAIWAVLTNEPEQAIR